VFVRLPIQIHIEPKLFEEKPLWDGNRCKNLSDRLHHGVVHLYCGTAELFDTDDDTRLAVDGNELAFQAGKRSFDHAYLFTGTERAGVEVDGVLGIIYHEAELLHLCCRDDSGGMFAAEYHVAHRGSHRRRSSWG